MTLDAPKIEDVAELNADALLRLELIAYSAILANPRND